LGNSANFFSFTDYDPNTLLPHSFKSSENGNESQNIGLRYAITQTPLLPHSGFLCYAINKDMARSHEMEHYQIKHCETEEEIQQAFEIRRRVFIMEQQIDKNLERDDQDKHADHFLAFADGKVVGAARLVTQANNHAKLGRMAVLKEYRRQGVGRDLLKATLEVARNQQIEAIVLHAQASARTFYVAMGFKEDGRPFMEAGIPHQTMIKELMNT